MDKLNKIIDPILITLGGAYSLANLQSLLGIVLLIIQLLWILTKVVCKAIKTIKHNESLDEIDKDIEEAVEIIKALTEKENSNGNDTDKQE